ncbi:MAG: hypothetical protein ACI857_003023 [Arenicella sp.]
MKQVFFILSVLFLFSCKSKNTSASATEIQIDTLNLIPHELNGDTVIAHADTIRYWRWDEYKASWYWEEPGVTTLRYNHFKYRIDGKFSKEAWEERHDTLFINEDVGWYLQARTMWIDAENDSDKFEVALSVEQSIWEQFDYDWYQDSTFNHEKWDKESYSRMERSDYYALEDSAGHYKIPGDFTGFFHDRFIEGHEYDTISNFVDSEGGGSYASFEINNKPCCWMADYGVFRITRITPQGIKSEHYFKVFYSYGC